MLPTTFYGNQKQPLPGRGFEIICAMIFVHVPNQLQTPWKKVHETMEMKKATINSSQRCSGRYTGIVTISINQPHVGIYNYINLTQIYQSPWILWKDLPRNTPTVSSFTKTHLTFRLNPPPASNAPSRQGPVPPSQWTVKFLWGSPHEIRFTKWQRGVSEILERRNHLCGVQPTSWRKLVGWFTVNMFLFWKMMLL